MACRQRARSAVALLALLSCCPVVLAQDLAQDLAPIPGAGAGAQQEIAPEPLSEAEQAALREALDFDTPLAASGAPAARAAREPSAAGLNWHRTEKSDGSADITVKRPLPTPWESSLGADFGHAVPSALTGAERALEASPEQTKGAAWANIKVPGLASIDARLGASEPSRLGATLSRSLPIGNNSVTLQSSYAVTESLATIAAPADSAPVWSTDRMLKFNIRATGTTLGAATTSSSADNATHNKISAEQKLFDRLNVTTAITDVGTPTSSKSITAGFQLKW